ncbi:thiol:disulfide interchange protein DsbG [Pistricoccus aurantiacus]|uniref:Thiol:disulfide interchange protein n=1 Tax=Pistricoccus aurantiacus TaxID=1883414 RepID=A0A5B8ST41_9GAMM|nr:thiol:disulfide interchange protein DsbG [Pistricoccus aurantiacus]QEA38263.1 thiol:disulfide interchange protein DsbG [Pistricoccus aurantiacus]
MSPTFCRSRLVLPLTAGLLTLGLITGQAQAQEQSSNLPAPIQFLTTQGLEVHGTFEAPGDLTGYAASVQGQPMAVYLTGDGKHAIIGNLIDAEGNNLSSEPLEKLVSGPKNAENWAQLEDSAWIQDGDKNAPRILYVFTDPNCPYCKKFWEEARPWIESGDVQMRHIMIGILRPDSSDKAAALLAADDPEQALNDYYLEDDQKPTSQPTETAKEKVEDNNRLMKDAELYATPTIFYRNGDEVGVAQGVPQGDKMEEVMGSARP